MREIFPQNCFWTGNWIHLPTHLTLFHLKNLSIFATATIWVHKFLMLSFSWMVYSFPTQRRRQHILQEAQQPGTSFHNKMSPETGTTSVQESSKAALPTWFSAYLSYHWNFHWESLLPFLNGKKYTVTIRKISAVEQRYRRCNSKGTNTNGKALKGVLTQLWRCKLTGKTSQGRISSQRPFPCASQPLNEV